MSSQQQVVRKKTCGSKSISILTGRDLPTLSLQDLTFKPR
jgi:hypothetical protein